MAVHLRTVLSTTSAPYFVELLKLIVSGKTSAFKVIIVEETILLKSNAFLFILSLYNPDWYKGSM